MTLASLVTKLQALDQTLELDATIEHVYESGIYALEVNFHDAETQHELAYLFKQQPNTRARWCDKCGAQPGHPCISKTGKDTTDHNCRVWRRMI